MDILQELRNSGKKGKDLNSHLAKYFELNKPSATDFSQAVQKATAVERGACVEALEYLTQQKPVFAKPYLNLVINCLSDQAPRVKWESARIIANVASTFPVDVATAIPNLITNASDKGTVVRWSAAFALGEIAKSSPPLQKTLTTQMESLSQTEKNNGVRNIYFKAIKTIRTD